ncbi:MAG: SRPBCC family protein [Bacteroidia bacterium]
MKYAVSIEIGLSLERVIELFDNPDNLKYWMEGIVGFELISGQPRQPGSKYKLTFKQGKRTVVMIETITVRNPPHELSWSFDINGTQNNVRNLFERISENKTRLTNEQEFIAKGFMKIMGRLFKGMFKKQSLKYMNAFKKFAESKK